LIPNARYLMGASSPRSTLPTTQHELSLIKEEGMELRKLLMLAGTLAMVACDPWDGQIAGPACALSDNDEAYATECTLQEDTPVTAAPEATEELETEF
jgi:hypothetical protein